MLTWGFVDSAAAADLSFFNAYHPYADHLTFMTQLVSAYPTHAETFTVGTSVQGRVITGIHIYGSGGKGTKPAIIFHGTVHAREWITTMVTQYFSYLLLSSYATDTAIKAFVDKYDFYIIPVVNPDGECRYTQILGGWNVLANCSCCVGFVYSQTTQRLWRKNRQTDSSSSCVGRDINRNWAWKWDLPGGASTDPCSETFRGIPYPPNKNLYPHINPNLPGRAAGDTPEFQSLSTFQNRLAGTTPGVKLYIDWHSYSQVFMTPYGYTCATLPTNNAELQTLAKGDVAAVKANSGMKYTAGGICNTLYAVTGGSVDYTYDVSKVKYSFTTELRDTGTYGFVLPASQILPTARENWEGVRFLLNNMK